MYTEHLAWETINDRVISRDKPKDSPPTGLLAPAARPGAAVASVMTLFLYSMWQCTIIPNPSPVPHSCSVFFFLF